MSNNHKSHSKDKKEAQDIDFEGFDDIETNDEEGEGGEVAQESKPALSYASHQELEQQLADAEAKANENWDKLLRTKAEFDNLRRRAEIDVANAHKFGLEKFVRELIPVLDSLEQGLAVKVEESEGVKNLHHGMELTATMLLKALEKFGVKQIDPVGETFNPTFHEAMTMQEQPGVAANTILSVLQKGYELNGRLVRPARVIVAK